MTGVRCQKAENRNQLTRLRSCRAGHRARPARSGIGTVAGPTALGLIYKPECVQQASKTQLFPNLSSALCLLSSIFCPLSSVLCPLSSVLCHLSSVICHPVRSLFIGNDKNECMLWLNGKNNKNRLAKKTCSTSMKECPESVTASGR